MNMQYVTVIAKKRQVLPANVLPKSVGLEAKCALENNIDIIAHVVISTHENSRPDICVDIYTVTVTRLTKIKELK